jgi:hypothetical protein
MPFTSGAGSSRSSTFNRIPFTAARDGDKYQGYQPSPSVLPNNNHANMNNTLFYNHDFPQQSTTLRYPAENTSAMIPSLHSQSHLHIHSHQDQQRQEHYSSAPSKYYAYNTPQHPHGAVNGATHAHTLPTSPPPPPQHPQHAVYTHQPLLPPIPLLDGKRSISMVISL